MGDGAEDGRTPEPPALAEARRWLVAGEYARVIAAARAGRERGEARGEWWMLEADALRGQGEREAAAESYDRAASALSPSRATVAGLKAATVWSALGRPADALASLERSRAAQTGSPVEERALALRVRALHAVGRVDEARAQARSYLVRFPAGGAREAMERALGEESTTP
jgi:tetratricopeptide (TPR) repeat protein